MLLSDVFSGVFSGVVRVKFAGQASRTLGNALIFAQMLSGEVSVFQVAPSF